MLYVHYSGLEVTKDEYWKFGKGEFYHLPCLPPTCFVIHQIMLMSASSRLVEGRYRDSSVPDPLSNMFALLETKQGKDRAMLRKWGVWLTIRDPERGLRVSLRRYELFATEHCLLQLLMSTKRSTKEKDREEDLAVLSELQGSHSAAARKFLEWLVIVRKRDVCFMFYVRIRIHDRRLTWSQ